MLRGKRRTVELVDDLGQLERNALGCVYTGGCAVFCGATSGVLLAAGRGGTRAPALVAGTYLADIVVAAAVLFGLYERRVLYAPYVLSTLTLLLAVLKTAVLFFFVDPLYLVAIGLANVLSSVRPVIIRVPVLTRR